MRELQSIIQYYHQFKAENLRLALATVVHVENSSYRRTGARMLITEDGQWTGGISGGCLEGDTLRKAKHSILNQKPIIIRYDTRDGDPNEIGVGLGCHGLIDVIVSPINIQDTFNSIYTLELSLQDRKPKVLLTLIEGKLNNIHLGKVYQALDFLSNVNVDFHQNIKHDIDLIFQQKKSGLKEYNTESTPIKIFIEFLPPPIHIVICGRNYDTIPLLKICKEIGWKVSIVSNPSKVSKELLFMADDVYSAIDNVALDSYTAILLMSHDYKTDLNNLQKIINTHPEYIGLLGPKDRRDKMLSELSISKKLSLDKIYGPIGLDTGATTPEEIAISIIAEISAYFNGRNGGNLRDRNRPINH